MIEKHKSGTSGDSQKKVVKMRINHCRGKQTLIVKKLERFGEMGKIPMAATMRVLYEEEEESSSSITETVSSSSESRSSAQSNSSADRSAFEKLKKNYLEMKEKEQVFNKEPALMPSYKRVILDLED